MLYGVPCPFPTPTSLRMPWAWASGMPGWESPGNEQGDWDCPGLGGAGGRGPQGQGGAERVLTLLGRGQHSLQPLLQGVVAVDGWRVCHDGDPCLVGCVESFYVDVCLQDHSVAWERRRTQSVRNFFSPSSKCDTFIKEHLENTEKQEEQYSSTFPS